VHIWRERGKKKLTSPFYSRERGNKPARGGGDGKRGKKGRMCSSAVPTGEKKKFLRRPEKEKSGLRKKWCREKKKKGGCSIPCCL